METECVRTIHYNGEAFYRITGLDSVQLKRKASPIPKSVGGVFFVLGKTLGRAKKVLLSLACALALPLLMVLIIVTESG